MPDTPLFPAYVRFSALGMPEKKNVLKRFLKWKSHSRFENGFSVGIRHSGRSAGQEALLPRPVAHGHKVHTACLRLFPCGLR